MVSMRLVRRSLRGISAFLAVLVLFGTVVGAQDTPTLTIGEVVSIPNEPDVPVPVSISTDDEIHQLSIAITYADNRLTLTDVKTFRGVLEDVSLPFSNIDTSDVGEVTIEFTLDSIEPYDNVIPVGDDQLVAELIFDVDNFQFEGTESTIEFTDGLGPDGDIDNLVWIDGESETPTLEDGSITITEENTIRLPSFPVRPGTEDIDCSIIGFNVEEIQGYQVAFTFEPDYIQLGDDFSVEDTMADAVGAEFVASIIDNEEGTAILGVLLDMLPPFEGQSIPAAGITIELGLFELTVTDEAEDVDETLLTLTDGLGSPPIDNVFVIDSLNSTTPVFVDGVINIIQPLPFKRLELNDDGVLNMVDVFVILNYLFGDGHRPDCMKACDVNDTGWVNIADAQAGLNYLYAGGPEPPEPFDEEGLDPTSDSLRCEEKY